MKTIDEGVGKNMQIFILNSTIAEQYQKKKMKMKTSVLPKINSGRMEMKILEVNID